MCVLCVWDLEVVVIFWEEYLCNIGRMVVSVLCKVVKVS